MWEAEVLFALATQNYVLQLGVWCCLAANITRMVTSSDMIKIPTACTAKLVLVSTAVRPISTSG
jgi:hypothetical protein